VLFRSLKKTSDSKKGYGNLASRSKRSEAVLTNQQTPGAGTYNVNFEAIAKRNDFSKGFSSQFQKPIANTSDREDKESKLPGPTQYDIAKAYKQQFRSNNVCADAAFKSQSRRQAYSGDASRLNPAPGQYNIAQDDYHNLKAALSSFKSNTKRHAFSPLSDMPGPADYRPNEPLQEKIFRQLFPRKHYLAISAPAIPPPPDIPMPGPGSYELRSFKEPEKKYMSSAVFVSCTSRWTGEQNDQTIPGPTNYSPLKLAKQSFHYNFEKKWV